MLTLVYNHVWVAPASSRADEISVEGRTSRPVAKLHFHGDVRFTPEQRVAIVAGMRAVERTSCGFVESDVIWDVDNVIKHVALGEQLIVSSTTEDIVAMKGPDGEFNLGLTVNFGVKWIFLVAPKLGDDMSRWEWVVAHEITHAAGMMDHVQNGLMEPEAPWIILDEPMWFDEDVALFCKRYRCQPKMFDSCRYRF